MNQQILWIMIASTMTTTILMVTNFGIGVASVQTDDNSTIANMTSGDNNNGATTEGTDSIATPYDYSQENNTIPDPQECDHPSNCNRGHLP